jgi:hypothetical protein
MMVLDGEADAFLRIVFIHDRGVIRHEFLHLQRVVQDGEPLRLVELRGGSLRRPPL